MNFDLEKMIESKRAYRARLAALPIGEKLRMLDALRERQRSLRDTATPSETSVLHEEPGTYDGGKK